jgi:hypothetical protein
MRGEIDNAKFIFTELNNIPNKETEYLNNSITHLDLTKEHCPHKCM